MLLLIILTMRRLGLATFQDLAIAKLVGVPQVSIFRPLLLIVASRTEEEEKSIRNRRIFHFENYQTKLTNEDDLDCIIAELNSI